jgi:hypothetical protein
MSSWNQRRRRRSRDIGLFHRRLDAHDTAACGGNRPLIAAIAAEFAICPDSGGTMRRIATVASSNAAFPMRYYDRPATSSARQAMRSLARTLHSLKTSHGFVWPQLQLQQAPLTDVIF